MGACIYMYVGWSLPTPPHPQSLTISHPFWGVGVVGVGVLSEKLEGGGRFREGHSHLKKQNNKTLKTNLKKQLIGTHFYYPHYFIKGPLFPNVSFSPTDPSELLNTAITVTN